MALAGCATQYPPRLGPHIAVTMSGGGLAYTRDGRVFEHGIAGGGLVDAVEGDPEATEAAETYRNRTIGGFAGELVSLVCFGAAVTDLSIRTSQQHPAGASTGALLVCALAGSAISSALLVSAQPYQWDAINLYNDHVDARRMPYWAPGPVPPPPLRMPNPPPSAVPAPTAQPSAMPPAPPAPSSTPAAPSAPSTPATPQP